MILLEVLVVSVQVVKLRKADVYPIKYKSVSGYLYCGWVSNLEIDRSLLYYTLVNGDKGIEIHEGLFDWGFAILITNQCFPWGIQLRKLPTQNWELVDTMDFQPSLKDCLFHHMQQNFAGPERRMEYKHMKGIK